MNKLYSYVIDEYQDWANRGYLEKLSCPRHYSISCVVGVDPEGLFIRCPLCVYKRIIGLSEYKRLENSVRSARREFEEE